MLKNGLLFVVLTLVSSDSRYILANYSEYVKVEYPELSVNEGEESVQILGRTSLIHNDCDRPIRTQASIWKDAVNKAPLNPRARLGVGVGLHEAADISMGRKCIEAALKFYEQAARSYGEVIQLSAGDPSPGGRTFRLSARMNLATIYTQVRDYDAAREVLNATLVERDAWLPAITRLAELEIRSGKPLDALAVTDRLRGKPIEDVAQLSIGQFWAVRAQAHCMIGDIEQANIEIKQARRSDPNVVKAKCTSGKEKS